MSNFNNTTLNNYSASESKKVELQVEPQIENNPDVTTSHHNESVRLKDIEDKLPQTLLGYNYEHLNEDTPREVIKCKNIGLDAEFIPSVYTYDNKSPAKPQIFVISYHSDRIPKRLLPLATEYPCVIKQSFGMLGCEYIEINKVKDVFPKLDSDKAVGYAISFGFYAGNLNAGNEFTKFLNLCFNNIAHTVGLVPLLNYIESDNEYEPNTVIWTTHSVAELCLMFPEKKDFNSYFKSLMPFWKSHSKDRNNKAKRDNYYNNRPKYKPLRNCTNIFNYWLPIFDTAVTVNFMDTKLFNGNSVPAIGGSLGCDKVDGFDHKVYTALQHYNYDKYGYYHYCAIDSVISLGIVFLIDYYLDIFDLLSQELDINPIYAHTPSNEEIKWRDKAEKCQTVSSIAENIDLMFMREKGYFSDTKCEKGSFVKSREFVLDHFSKSQLKVKGGNNNRLTDTGNPEVYHHVKQFDAKSMYPSICRSFKLPLYEPVAVGHQKIKAKDLYEQLKDNDWFDLTVSFDFPEGMPIIKRQFVQNVDGVTHCYRKVEKQVIRPPELELILDEKENQDIEITVHHGWRYDPSLVDKEDRHYLDLSPLINVLFNLRKKFKPKKDKDGNVIDEGNKLIEIAIKLIMNVGSFGKFAQCKEIPDPDALENLMLNDGDISAIAVNTTSTSKIYHPEFANAITAFARALNAMVAKEHSAILSVTDSVLTKEDVNLQNCIKGWKWLDPVVKSSQYEDELDGKDYTAIITGKRGRTLVPYNRDFAILSDNLDSEEKLDKAIKSIDYFRLKMETEGETPPKIAKDGVKYEGDDYDQWCECSIDNLKRLYGEVVYRTQTHLATHKEVLKDLEPYPNHASEKGKTLDCYDFGSYPYDDYQEHLRMKRVQAKLKVTHKSLSDKNVGKLVDKPYSTAGQAIRFYPDDFEKSFNRSKTRKRVKQKFTNDELRQLLFLTELKKIKLADVARILDCSRQHVFTLRNELLSSGNFNLWFDKTFEEILEKAKVSKYKEMNNLCSIDTLKQISEGIGDDVTQKKVDKFINGLIARIETRYEVTITAKKRSKYLKVA